MCRIKAIINRDSWARPPPDTPQNRLIVHRFQSPVCRLDCSGGFDGDKSIGLYDLLRPVAEPSPGILQFSSLTLRRRFALMETYSRGRLAQLARAHGSHP